MTYASTILFSRETWATFPRHDDAQLGGFLAATDAAILTGVGHDNPAFRKEIFSPVAMVFRAADKDEVSLANDSAVRLGGAVMTAGAAHGGRAAELIDAEVFINDIVVSITELPFGGVESADCGRDLFGLDIQDFVSKKLIFTAPSCAGVAA